MAQADGVTPATSPNGATAFSRSSTAIGEAWTGHGPPFAKSDELCEALQYPEDLARPRRFRSCASTRTLPDAPRVRLDEPSEILTYCMNDLDTPKLNLLHDKLWWACTSTKIESLTQHAVLDRRIQITEDPSVHCLWVEGTVYLKPLPLYLTSYAFWEYLYDTTSDRVAVQERERLRATALGFVRTYACLIQRRSDFDMARRSNLLPCCEITFETFVAFISAFDAVPDRAVSSRWRYGLIELDALNFRSAVHLRRWHLNRFESRYAAYFQRFFPVVLFIFALFSVALSAMQVILSAKQLWDTEDKSLKRILGAFVWAASEAIGWSVAFGVFFMIWWACISSVETWKRWKMMKRARKDFKGENAPAP